MATLPSEYRAQYRAANAEKLKAQDAERSRKRRDALMADPKALAVYKAKRRAEYLKKRPNARTREEIIANRTPRKIIPKSDTRECIDCKATKPLDQFPRHGTHGHKEFCLECRDKRGKASRAASQADYARRNRERLNEVKRQWAARQPKPEYDALAKKVAPKAQGKKRTLADDGWRLVISFGDPHEIIRVYMKGLVIRYLRMPATGEFSTGKTSYGVAFDDSGTRYQTLEKVERVAGVV